MKIPIRVESVHALIRPPFHQLIYWQIWEKNKKIRNGPWMSSSSSSTKRRQQCVRMCGKFERNPPPPKKKGIRERGAAVIEWAIDRCIFDESGWWWFALRLAASSAAVKKKKGREREYVERSGEGAAHRETHRSSPCHRLISGLISCLSHVCNWIAPIHHHTEICLF